MACDVLRECVIWNMILDEFCILTRKTVVRILFPAVIAIVGLLLSGMARADDAADLRETRFARWMHAGLLDPEAPIEQRRAIVGELEAIAKDDTQPGILYLLGSLYRQDPAHSNSRVEQDLNRARELLSRAALRGKIPAMAKLSTIELQSGNRFEANVWAQLYYHYAKDLATVDPRWTDGFAASILRHAQDGFPKEDIEALSSTVGSMITQYDAQIRLGLKKLVESESGSRFRDARPGTRVLMNPETSKGRNLEAGISEYVLEFAADGSVKQAWAIDAWPNSRLARILHKIALGYRVEPGVAQEASGMLAVLHVILDDRRYKIHDEAAKD